MEEYGYIRLSIDEEVWSANGRYGIDYPVERRILMNYGSALRFAASRLHGRLNFA